MISCIEALGYRSLRDVQQTLQAFQVLVGPNASGKSTFLDVSLFIGDLLRLGVVEAVRSRSPNPRNLVWMEAADRFELAIELRIPEERRARLRNGHEEARYEVAIGQDAAGELVIFGETLWLKPGAQAQSNTRRQRSLFPEQRDIRPVLVSPEGQRAPAGWKRVVTKRSESGNDYFFSETSGWNNPFRLGPRKTSLANLPEDEERFPVATWVRRTLMEGLQRLALHSEAMRRPSPPGSPAGFAADGSNLPWAVERLRLKDGGRFDQWIAHVRTALPDVRAITTVERPEDKHRYLQIEFGTGLKTPSWTVSDGTLRLLALTLVAYLDEPGSIYVIEEPENGIHPQAVECVFQALSSTYDSQVLCASHSPVVLSLAEPGQLLCFARTPGGATDVVRGTEHPRLAEWQRQIDLGTLFAAGVLG